MQLAEHEVFKRDLFIDLCGQRGWDTDAEVARTFKVSQSQICRLLAGEQAPSLKFANKCRLVFGTEAFEQLFPLPEYEEVGS